MERGRTREKCRRRKLCKGEEMTPVFSDHTGHLQEKMFIDDVCRALTVLYLSSVLSSRPLNTSNNRG